MEQWIDSFIEYLRSERNYSQRTLESYSADLVDCQKFLQGLDAEVDWKSLDASTIREWMIYMLDAQSYSSATVNRHLSALRSFYRYLRKMGWVEISPTTKIEGPKKKKALPVFVKENDMDRLFDIMSEDESFAGVRNRLIIMMFYETGIRRTEMLNLKVGDVDLPAKQIKVLGKRNKERIIPFGKELEDEICRYLSLRSQVLKDVCPPSGDSSMQSDTHVSNALFISEKGASITNSQLGDVVKKNLSLVTNQAKRTPHVLRHSFATAMLNNEADLGSIQKLLGHASLATTEVYTHLSFEELKNAYKNAHPRK